MTDYLTLYHLSARELGQQIMTEIFRSTGIRATCGVGSNLYLAKIALDITAKHAEDFIGELNEDSYRTQLWDHRPLTDFWRIGSGTARRLEPYGIRTMRDIAEADEDFLYHLFGIDAELLIDHAFGRETVTMADIKSYRSHTNCLGSGQVLGSDYSFDKGLLVVKEMMDLLCLDLVEKNLITGSVTLHVGYANRFNVTSAHGTTSTDVETNSDLLLIPAVTDLYRRIVNPAYPIHRINITCNNVMPEEYHQYNFFLDGAELERSRRMQQAVISIKNRFGKDAILKGMNLEEGATTRERNHQIGGHKSGL